MKNIIIFLILIFNQSYASNVGEVTGYQIPRFVSLKSDDVNLRVGPSKNYPIKINYIQKNFPVEIIDEYDVWRQIKDIDGNKGWILGSLLKGDRFGIVSSQEIIVYKNPLGSPTGKIGINNIVKLKKCLKDFCLISLKDFKGWVNKEDLWGVYNLEEFNVNFFQPIIKIYWKILSK